MKRILHLAVAGLAFGLSAGFGLLVMVKAPDLARAHVTAFKAHAAAWVKEIRK